MNQRFPKSIKRSLFWLLDSYPDIEGNDVGAMNKAIAHSRLAETLGFSAVWCAEHHFQTLGGVPNPAVFLAAVAQQTKSLRLGSAISVLPLHNPIQIAEDYAMVDQLSNGRLNMGVGSGSQPIEAQGMGTVYEDRFKCFEQHLSDILKRWQLAAQGDITIESINVVPVQKPSPPIYVTSNQASVAYKIGLAGQSLLTIVTPSVESLTTISQRIEAHKQGLSDGGYCLEAAEAVVVVFTHINKTEERAKTIAIPALGHLLSMLSGNKVADATDIYYMMQAKGTGFFGSEQRVPELLIDYQAMGIQHIAFLNRFGAMAWQDAEQSLSLLI